MRRTFLKLSVVIIFSAVVQATDVNIMPSCTLNGATAPSMSCGSGFALGSQTTSLEGAGGNAISFHLTSNSSGGPGSTSATLTITGYLSTAASGPGFLTWQAQGDTDGSSVIPGAITGGGSTSAIGYVPDDVATPTWSLGGAQPVTRLGNGSIPVSLDQPVGFRILVGSFFSCVPTGQVSCGNIGMVEDVQFKFLDQNGAAVPITVSATPEPSELLIVAGILAVAIIKRIRKLSR